MNKQPYKEAGNMYSVAAEIHRKKREKRRRIMIRVLCIAGVAAVTLALHAFNVWYNGYDGIGSECLIPVAAFFAYVVYKGMKNDERKRQAHREYLERKAREREFQEYERSGDVNDCIRIKVN